MAMQGTAHSENSGSQRSTCARTAGLNAAAIIIRSDTGSIMKHLSSLPLVLCLGLISACEGDDVQSDSKYENVQNAGDVRFLKPAGNAAQAREKNNAAAGREDNVQARVKTELEMKPLRDAKTGRITSYLPLPVDWKVHPPGSGLPLIEGPGGISVTDNPPEQYYYNVADPQVAQMAGMTLANPVPLETIFRDNVVPAIQELGGKLLKEYALPEIAQRSHRILQKVLTRSRINYVKLHASEWRQSNGKKSLILLSQMDMTSQGLSSWWVSMTEVEAPAQSFEEAKQIYLFAQANFQPDLETARAHAGEVDRRERESQEMINQSWAAHNRRMQANEAAFQATQKAHVETSNAISDMSMQGYRDRSASSDRMQRNQVDAIHEENSLRNPWDEDRDLQVESGYDTYYMNSAGNVIGSNNPNFDPNVDRSYNDTEWRVMPKID